MLENFDGTKEVHGQTVKMSIRKTMFNIPPDLCNLFVTVRTNKRIHEQTNWLTRVTARDTYVSYKSESNTHLSVSSNMGESENPGRNWHLEVKVKPR